MAATMAVPTILLTNDLSNEANEMSEENAERERERKKKKKRKFQSCDVWIEMLAYGTHAIA